MKDRDDFKSQIISSQKPRKRRGKTSGRYVDLIKLHRDIVAAERQRRRVKFTWVKGVLFILIASPVFFLLGCLISALSMPGWVRALVLISTAALAFISSHLVATLFR